MKARLRRLRARHLVFATGMLALAAGASLSLWMVLGRPGPGPAAGPDVSGLSQVFQDTLGLAQEQAEALADRLQSRQVGTPSGEEASLPQVLEQTLGLAQEQAEALAAQLQAAVERARAQGERSPAPSGGGMSDKASIGDSVQFEIRDASGKLKGRGGGR